jgi:hypothetical protein
MSVGPSTSGFGFVLCKAKCTQLDRSRRKPAGRRACAPSQRASREASAGGLPKAPALMMGSIAPTTVHCARKCRQTEAVVVGPSGSHRTCAHSDRQPSAKAPRSLPGRVLGPGWICKVASARWLSISREDRAKLRSLPRLAPRAPGWAWKSSWQGGRSHPVRGVRLGRTGDEELPGVGGSSSASYVMVRSPTSGWAGDELYVRSAHGPNTRGSAARRPATRGRRPGMGQRAAPRCDLGSPGPVHALIYKRGFVDGFGLVPLDPGPDAGVATMPWRRGGAAEHGSLVGVEDALERSIVTAGQTAERKGRDDRVDPRT